MAGPAVISDEPGPERTSAFGWAVFALSFGLLMSDHMARQVLNAAGPQIQAEWNLNNAELASLASVVALAVGLLTLPLSYLADRYGRVKSLVAMATLWSLATLAGAWVENYPQMLAARVLVGVGEAAYGSVGIAVVLAVFPVHLRATLSSSFLAGSVVGQILGVAVGAQVAAVYGWRAAFGVIGLFGLVLALIYPLVVRESRLGVPPKREALNWRELGRLLVGRPVLWLTYFAGGIQLFCTGTLAVFLPILLTRHYGMDLTQAGRTTALFLLVCAIGMVGCGMLVDRLSRRRPAITPRLSIGFSLSSTALFAGAFFSPPGPVQLALIAAALLVVAGITGVTGSMIANCTPRSIHSTSMAVLALAYNLLGLAPGPYVTGLLADRFELLDALKVLPIPCLLSALAMAFARRPYAAEMAIRK
ncbi:MFS transporter [Novosphingobium sp. B 225]|uniref:MFS transporter n=1 Tax=Novosphingobium sp. B 225 TaxID=1961849 RepID=UPI000B4AD9BF|nr:MFS transporter [Novosphingobium sp. B 225]